MTTPANEPAPTPTPAPAVEPAPTPIPEPKKTPEIDVTAVAAKNRALEGQLSDLQKKIDEQKTLDMKKNEEWKTLAEDYETKYTAEQKKTSTIMESIKSDKRTNAITREAAKLGIREDAMPDLDLIDFSTDILIEQTDTGRYNVIGAEKAAQKLKEMRPHWFNANAPKFDSNTPTTTSTGQVTIKDVQKAEIESKKTGDLSGYKAILLQFKQQGANK